MTLMIKKQVVTKRKYMYTQVIERIAAGIGGIQTKTTSTKHTTYVKTDTTKHKLNKISMRQKLHVNSIAIV